MIFTQVVQMQRRNLLEPLLADAILVLSRQWSVLAHHRVAHATDIPSEVPARNLSAAVSHHAPVSQVVAPNDSAFFRWLSQQGEMAPVQLELASWRAQELWSSTSRHGAHDYFVPMVRWRVCLRLVTMAEVAGGGKYRQVLRMRPDVFTLCRMQLPCEKPLTPQPAPCWKRNGTQQWAAFWWDHLSIMPRDVAEVALRQLSVLGAVKLRHSPLCNSSQAQMCNPCLLEAQGVRIIALDHLSFMLPGMRQLIQVARHCNTLQAARREQCLGFSGPPMLEQDASHARACPNVLQLGRYRSDPRHAWFAQGWKGPRTACRQAGAI